MEERLICEFKSKYFSSIRNCHQLSSTAATQFHHICVTMFPLKYGALPAVHCLLLLLLLCNCPFIMQKYLKMQRLKFRLENWNFQSIHCRKIIKFHCTHYNTQRSQDSNPRHRFRFLNVTENCIQLYYIITYTRIGFIYEMMKYLCDVNMVVSLVWNIYEMMMFRGHSRTKYLWNDDVSRT